MLRFLADWQANQNVANSNVDALMIFLKTFADWKDPGAPETASPADAQTQIDQYLKTHRLKLEAEEKERVRIQSAMRVRHNSERKARKSTQTSVTSRPVRTW